MSYSLFGHYSWAPIWIGVWPCTAAGAGDICVLCEPLLARDCQGRGCLQCATPGCGIPGWGHCGLYPGHALSQRTQWSFFITCKKGTSRVTQHQCAPWLKGLERVSDPGFSSYPGWIERSLQGLAGVVQRSLSLLAHARREMQDSPELTACYRGSSKRCGSVSTDKSFLLFITYKTGESRKVWQM